MSAVLGHAVSVSVERSTRLLLASSNSFVLVTGLMGWFIFPPALVFVRFLGCVCNSPHCQDLVSTGDSGYEFIKLDAGMTELLRPSLYGALHPLVVVPSKVREAIFFSGLSRDFWTRVLQEACAFLPLLALDAPGDPHIHCSATKVYPKRSLTAGVPAYPMLRKLFLWRGIC